VDAIFHVSDATVTGHADLVVQAATAKRLPLIAQDREGVLRGALASYGPSYYTSGRLMAKYVQRVLLGAHPGDLPVEQFAKLRFVVNLKTAKAIGFAIPQAILARADEVVQ
jgi:putative ABC transport system substrate-binding protein